MIDDRTPAIPCAVCGGQMHLQDAVIVLREVLPSWVSPIELSRPAIFHKACRFDGVRADHNWTREAPQTLAHVLATTAR